MSAGVRVGLSWCCPVTREGRAPLRSRGVEDVLSRPVPGQSKGLLVW